MERCIAVLLDTHVSGGMRYNESCNDVITVIITLTHWGRYKMAAILRTTILNAFFNANVWISIYISLNIVPKGPINNSPTMVKIMAWSINTLPGLNELRKFNHKQYLCWTKFCVFIGLRQSLHYISAIFYSGNFLFEASTSYFNIS